MTKRKRSYGSIPTLPKKNLARRICRKLKGPKQTPAQMKKCVRTMLTLPRATLVEQVILYGRSSSATSKRPYARPAGTRGPGFVRIKPRQIHSRMFEP